MRHIFSSILLAVVFWVCMICEWWLMAIIVIAMLWVYFGLWVFFLVCRNWPDSSWTDNA